MEYTQDQYRRKGGKVITSSDGYKYLCHKAKNDIHYLKCTFFKNGCKGTAKLNLEVNLVYPKSEHNHNVEKYNTEVHEIKTKIKRKAMTSRNNLREIFNEVTRSDPAGSLVTFKECESSMFRARKLLQPKIPQSASEFCKQLPATNFVLHLKATIELEDRIAVIFFSDRIYEIVSDGNKIDFDGTFYAVPKQFYQFLTLFITIGRHTIPLIHCLLTNKDEELYTAVLFKIKDLIPQLQPTSTMSDWEIGARNSFKNVYSGTRIYGCWFHYTQAIWRKIQKCRLTLSYKGNTELATFIRKVMALPFLPSDLIVSTYSMLSIPTLVDTEMPKLEAFLRYFEKYWLTQINPEELSIFDLNNGTNNGAESYHARLKSVVKSSHPRVWNFMMILNELIADYDNELSRLEQGREITRCRKKKNRINDELRTVCKERLISGIYTPFKFLECLSQSSANCISLNQSTDFLSDDSDLNDEPDTSSKNLCVVCLQQRSNTWIFMPCRHANCCAQCSATIDQLGQNCPTCRSPIEEMFQIFIN